MMTNKTTRGFTIVELMVVLLIMLLLLAVLTPTVQKIYRSTMRSTALSTLHLIEGACKQYCEQFDEFPPSNHPSYSGWQGSELLVLFLTGYGHDPGTKGEPSGTLDVDDGKTGFGFRVEKAGLVFGPYNGTEKIKTKKSGNGRPVFVDSFDEQVYYYRFDPALPGYRATDNDAAGPIAAIGPSYAEVVGGDGSAVIGRRDFILATRGPDGVFESVVEHAETDDITNFIKEQ